MLIATLALGLASCGGGSSISDWANSFASGLAIASPTAQKTSSVVVNDAAAPKNLDASADFAAKTAVFDAVVAATGTCAISLPTLNGFGNKATCYGPEVNYTNHQDGADASPARLPSGDLGFWTATNGSNSEACAAAQMNSVVSSVSAYIDTAMALQAMAICTEKAKSAEVPSEGDTIDMKADLSATIATLTNAPTLTTASVKADSDDQFTYKFTGTKGGGEFSITVTHKVKNDDNTKFEGRIYGYFNVNSKKDAFSVTYTRDGATLNAQAYTGSWNSATNVASIFASNGDLVLSDNGQGNINQHIFNINKDSGEMNVSSGWQAGDQDSHKRVLHGYTKVSSGVLGGCGFFSYGPDFQATLANNTNAISGFICNWAGPANQNHSTQATNNAGKAQKQCFSQNASTGVFEEVTAKRAIMYAPTNSCNDTSSMTWTPMATGTADGLTNNLVTLGSDSDYSIFTAPTAPSISF